MASGHYVRGVAACPLVGQFVFQFLMDVRVEESFRSYVGRVESLYVQKRIVPAPVCRAQDVPPAEERTVIQRALSSPFHGQSAQSEP